MFSLFSDLGSLSPGSYLVQHDKNTGAFCRLLKPSEGNRSKTLLHYCSLSHFWGLKNFTQEQLQKIYWF